MSEPTGLAGGVQGLCKVRARTREAPLGFGSMRLFDDRCRRRSAMREDTTTPSLVAYLAQLPEYRQARGRQHPLLALLLVGVALRCGARWPSASTGCGAAAAPRIACRGEGFRSCHSAPLISRVPRLQHPV